MPRNQGGIKGAHVTYCSEHIRATLSLNFSLMAALGGGNAFLLLLVFFSSTMASCHIQSGLPVSLKAWVHSLCGGPGSHTKAGSPSFQRSGSLKIKVCSFRILNQSQSCFVLLSLFSSKTMQFTKRVFIACHVFIQNMSCVLWNIFQTLRTRTILFLELCVTSHLSLRSPTYKPVMQRNCSLLPV